MNDWLTQVFIENIGAALLFPLADNLTYEAMVWFNHPVGMATVAAALGAALGALVTWLLGWLCALLRSRHAASGSDASFLLARGAVGRYVPFLLPFAWLPLGAVLVFVAGFFGVRWWLALPLAVAGWAIYLTFFFRDFPALS